jgi:hypothetical protein
MESFELEPKYSTKEIPGKCLKCLAEHELNSCLMMLLSEDGDDESARRKFEALVSFLQSPESKVLRDESERLLAEGKRVSVKMVFSGDRPRYELVVSEGEESA